MKCLRSPAVEPIATQSTEKPEVPPIVERLKDDNDVVGEFLAEMAPVELDGDGHDADVLSGRQTGDE